MNYALAPASVPYPALTRARVHLSCYAPIQARLRLALPHTCNRIRLIFGNTCTRPVPCTHSRPGLVLMHLFTPLYSPCAYLPVSYIRPRPVSMSFLTLVPTSHLRAHPLYSLARSSPYSCSRFRGLPYFPRIGGSCPDGYPLRGFWCQLGSPGMSMPTVVYARPCHYLPVSSRH